MLKYSYLVAMIEQIMILLIIVGSMEMELESKKTISVYGSIIGLVALMCLSAFSYAYFAVNSTPTNSLNIVASVSGDLLPVFTASSTGNLILDVTDADMMNGTAGAANTTIAATANQTLKVTMSGGSSSKTATCDFDFVWTRFFERVYN